MSGIYLCSSGTVTGHLAQAKKHVHKHQPLLNCMKKVNISPVFQITLNHFLPSCPGLKSQQILQTRSIKQEHLVKYLCT